MASRWGLLISSIPLIGKPVEIVFPEKNWIVLTTLLSLWRLDRVLVFVEDWSWSRPNYVIEVFDSLTVESSFFKLIIGFTVELQINDQIGLELGESIFILLFLVFHQWVAPLFHFQAHASDIIIEFHGSILAFLLPGPVKFMYWVKLISDKLKVGFIRCESQVSLRFTFKCFLCDFWLDESHFISCRPLLSLN